MLCAQSYLYILYIVYTFLRCIHENQHCFSSRLSENHLWPVQTHGKLMIWIKQSDSWWFPAETCSVWKHRQYLTSEILWEWNICKVTISQKTFFVFLFYPRTSSINKPSWGQRSNLAYPLERKFLCVLKKIYLGTFLEVQIDLINFIISVTYYLAITCKLSHNYDIYISLL